MSNIKMYTKEEIEKLVNTNVRVDTRSLTNIYDTFVLLVDVYSSYDEDGDLCYLGKVAYVGEQNSESDKVIEMNTDPGGICGYYEPTPQTDVGITREISCWDV